jgi:hypothetical protein
MDGHYNGPERNRVGGWRLVNLAQERKKGSVLVNTVTNVWVTNNAGNLTG